MREHRVLDKWQKAEIKFQDFAYFQCKSKKEWKEDENSMTKAKYSSLRYKSIEELKERYADKITRKYEIDLYWEKQIKNYEERVKQLKADIMHYEKCDLVAPKYSFGKPREESKFIHED